MSCPESFQFNCINFDTKCYECAALQKDTKIFYYFGVYDIGVHPFVKERKEQQAKDRADVRALIVEDSRAIKARHYNSKGRAMERKVIKSIPGAKLTYNSGATNGDGDGYIWIDDIKYGFSHKVRFSPRNMLGPTSGEWTKGKTEATDIWLTTSSTYGTIVTMRQETFDEFIELIARLRKESESK